MGQRLNVLRKIKEIKDKPVELPKEKEETQKESTESKEGG